MFDSADEFSGDYANGDEATMGEIEPEYVPRYLSGGAGGYPGAPQQSTPPVVYADYMAKLRLLGYNAPDSGNAFDPDVRAAVAAFQADHNLAVDGLGGQGSATFRAIDAAIANLGGPAAPPPGVVLVDPPSNVPGDIPLQPVVDVDEPSSIGKWLGLAAVSALVIGAGYYAFGRE